MKQIYLNFILVIRQSLTARFQKIVQRTCMMMRTTELFWSPGVELIHVKLLCSRAPLKDMETAGGSLLRSREANPGSVVSFIKGSVISHQGRWAKGETCNN